MRSGIFYFLIILLLFEVVRYRMKIAQPLISNDIISKHDEMQQWVDSCRLAIKRSFKTWTYNPNYLSESAAYRLGLTAAEFQRLTAFKNNGGVIYDFKTLQRLMGRSDSTSLPLQDKFRFPPKKGPKLLQKKQHTKHQVGLNQATANQLQGIRGIGPVLSARIVKFRDALGGFQNGNQLLDVYGLDPVIARRVSSVFPILNAPEVNVVNLNTASAAELSNLVYFSEKEVEIILAYRFSNGGIRSLKALGEVLGWNLDKIDRIAVYLAL